MTAPKIAIQGVRASFHDVALKKHFGSDKYSTLECDSFKKLCEGLSGHMCDLAIMAIENTIAGSILPNYSLMERYRFKIIGEVYLRIELAAMALPGRKLKDLQYVLSHPMALHQSEEFLLKNPQLQVIESADTAESAKKIADEKIGDSAAIASELAAETYGLTVLSHGIETNKQNYTRFLLLAREPEYEPATDANKSSIRFETSDKPGSLMRVLEIFKKYEINMTKLQSVPILGKPYQYSIHTDLEWSDRKVHAEAMSEVHKLSENLILFGEYKKGARPQ